MSGRDPKLGLINLPVLSPEVQVVLDQIAEYQTREAEPPLLRTVLLSRPPEAEAAVRVGIDVLKREGCIRTGGHQAFESLWLTASGIVASTRAADCNAIAARLLAFFRDRIRRDPGSFRTFTWSDLVAAGVVVGDQDFGLLLVLLEVFHLTSGGNHSKGPPISAEWSVPSSLPALRADNDLADLYLRMHFERVERAPSEVPVESPRKPPIQVGRWPTSRTLSILFMDLANWSKLTTPQVTAYLEKAFPVLGQTVKNYRPQLINTWGDAIVATFPSVISAATCALDIRDLFRRATEVQGVPRGLVRSSP